MKKAPDAVLLYIPLMKDLGMSWADIKSTSRVELEGILSAYSEYNLLHAFDGYSASDIGELAKGKPEVRSQYASYIEANRNLTERLGKKVRRPSIKDIIG
jgi:hypothetical protein